MRRISLLLLAACWHLGAIDLDRRLGQLYHTSWTVKDGAPPESDEIAQTPDGFLWFAGFTGLYRFDGVHFERYDRISDAHMPKTAAHSVIARPDGDLVVGWFRGGASLLSLRGVTGYGPESGFPANGTVMHYRNGPEGMSALLSDGRIVRLDQTGHWHNVGSGSPVEGNFNCFFVDRDGTQWVGTGKSIFYRGREGAEFRRIPGDGLAVSQTPDGTLWLQTPNAIRVLQNNRPGAALLTPPAGQTFGLYLFADREGSLWSGGNGKGILRFAHPELGLSGQTTLSEAFAARDGLSSDIVTCIFEDRDGDIWIATPLGVDRFRQSNLVPVRMPESTGYTFLSADEGRIQVASVFPRRVFSIRDEAVIGSDSLAEQPYSAYRSARGSIWFGTFGRGLFRYARGQLEPEDWPGERTGAMAEDQQGRLWIRVQGKGVFRRENGKWTSLAALGGPSTEGLSIVTDSIGRVWFGFEGNRVYMLNQESLTAFTSKEGVGTGGEVKDVSEAAGAIFISGDDGLEIFDGKRFIPVIPNDTDSFSNIWALLGSQQSGLWFMEARGVVHIPKAELYQVKNNPKHKVSYELFDDQDGLPSDLQRDSYRPSSIEDSDGRVWFATLTDIVWIDPRRILHNRVAPGVVIQSISANGKTYHSFSRLTFPPGTATARITFAAASLMIPERVRFRYQLEGVDKGWQDSGSRRETSYTNLGPGSYRFRVIACNNDGVWNQTGAVGDFTIAPALYQTFWFKSLYALVGVALLWVVYRLRLRQIAAAMGARFDERLAERTRIARDFHDTLLQTLQGSKMVADDALAEDADSAQVRRAVVLLAGWLGQAIQEGREALSSLRSSTTEDNDLSAALRRAADESRSLRPIEFDLSVEGSSKRMHPIARDEVYRIGYEAIRNACNHSGATRLAVKISYLYDFVLQVQDNGKGFESSAVNTETGRGHFGLVGMYERAARIPAKLTISSSPGGGTRVELIVPGSVVFPGQERARKLPKWKRLWQ